MVITGKDGYYRKGWLLPDRMAITGQDGYYRTGWLFPDRMAITGQDGYYRTEWLLPDRMLVPRQDVSSLPCVGWLPDKLLVSGQDLCSGQDVCSLIGCFYWTECLFPVMMLVSERECVLVSWLSDGSWTLS